MLCTLFNNNWFRIVAEDGNETIETPRVSRLIVPKSNIPPVWSLYTHLLHYFGWTVFENHGDATVTAPLLTSFTNMLLFYGTKEWCGVKIPSIYTDTTPYPADL